MPLPGSPACAAASSGWVLGAPAVPSRLEQLLTLVLPLAADGTPQQQQQQQVQVMMVAVNGGNVGGFPVADVEVHVGGERLWSDQVEGQVGPAGRWWWLLLWLWFCRCFHGGFSYMTVEVTWLVVFVVNIRTQYTSST
jgi:hypothetical protein